MKNATPYDPFVSNLPQWGTDRFDLIISLTNSEIITKAEARKFLGLPPITEDEARLDVTTLDKFAEGEHEYVRIMK